VRTRPSGATERLAVALERAALDALRRTYHELNATFFGDQLRPPALCLARTSQRLGRWDREQRMLEISWQLLAQYSWGVVVEVVKHEMAHQWVDEVLGCVGEPAHGPTFRRVCQERAIDARARGIPTPHADGDVGLRIVQRVAKLLALAESPNIHEAQSAALAAQRLMLKYNIDSVAHPSSRNYGFLHLGKPKGRTTESERILAAIIGEHFFVEVIWVPVWRPLEGKRGTVLEVCGTPENLELAQYAHSFLLRTAERLWQQYKREHGIRRDTNRRSFLAGVMAGFRDKLAAQQQSHQQQGLVWLGDAGLKSYLRKRHPHVRHARYTGRHRADVYGHGREAGAKIVLYRGVRQNPSSGRRLLPGPR
jgi:hypothetical protein